MRSRRARRDMQDEGTAAPQNPPQSRRIDALILRGAGRVNITRKGYPGTRLIPRTREDRPDRGADDSRMAVTAAPVVPRARETEFVDDELIRDTRTRIESERLRRRTRLTFTLVGCAFLVAAVATAVLVRDGPSFSWARMALFVAVYAAVSRVKFEVGTGSAIPTQLVLVPMLFAVPIGVVPGLVGIAFVVGALAGRPRAARSAGRIFPLLASATHALGPALVIGLFGGVPLRWSAWPVYTGALAAQFVFDFASAAITGTLAHGISLRTVARFMRWVWTVDATLAPVGLALAFATRSHAALVVLVLPLVGLLRHFAHERQRRIDQTLELSDAYRGTAFLLGDVVEADDAYTGTHSRHVVDLVLGVCGELGLGANDRRDAEFVALLHDVGKIRIPSSIINKPGPLDPEERAVIETHTIEGERMLDRVGGLLGHVGRIVRSCHERWDGAGYPDGLAGDAIPLVARIVCACDAFSAMTTDRPYRQALSHDEAVAELRRCRGTQFDPRVVDALARIADRGMTVSDDG
jgi:HD-GYP domain-containing protein (c-di-GMP phosphodiesterase class II)